MNRWMDDDDVDDGDDDDDDDDVDIDDDDDDALGGVGVAPTVDFGHIQQTMVLAWKTGHRQRLHAKGDPSVNTRREINKQGNHIYI